MSTEDRIVYLKRFINECDVAYYNKGTEIVPDEQYDNLKRELVLLEEGTDLDSDSASVRVGMPIEGGIPHQHVIPLLSLENAFSHDEVMKELARVEKNHDSQLYILEDKLDGLTGALTYIDGNLRVAATRGDGDTGECIDISGMDLPETIGDVAALDVIGEFVLTYDMFNRLNEEAEQAGRKQYISPRAAAVGLLRKDPSKLVFVAFSARYHDGSIFASKETDLLARLRSFNFQTVHHSKPIRSKDMVVELGKWEKDEDFDCDGIVIKLNDISLQEELGNRTRTPRWAFAYKKNSEGSPTVLKDVIWQVGCFGTITPVGIVDPVIASKAVVSRVTLHNPLFIMSLGVKLNGGVKVIRSGEVIPAIVGLVPELDKADIRPIPIPAQCPSCHTKLRPSGPELLCSNSQCPDRVIAQLIRMGSRDGLDITGLGDVTASKLVERELVVKPSDIFKVTLDKLLEAGFKDYESNRLVNSLSDIQVTLDKLYYSLCIPSIGVGNAKILAKAYPSIEELLNATPDGLMSNTSLETGEVVSVYEYFDGDNIYDNWPVVITEPETQHNNTLPLRTWVITGTLTQPRRIIEAKLNALNVTLSDRVGKNVERVVIGSKPTEHKVLRAGNLGIPVSTEDEMIQWITDNQESSHGN